MIPIIDYPKIMSPFVRKNHVLTDEIEKGYEWIFDNGVRAVDKLHGTNICVHIRDKKIVAIDNRDTRHFQNNEISIKDAQSKYLLGVLNSINRGWITSDGDFYGELIGPDINKNIHETDKYYFVPFDYLCSKHHWKSWIENRYPKNFESISEWFKEIPSLFTLNMFGKKVMAEGLVFYHPTNFNRRCKIRRDMFDWYKGESHK